MLREELQKQKLVRMGPQGAQRVGDAPCPCGYWPLVAFRHPQKRRQDVTVVKQKQKHTLDLRWKHFVSAMQ